MHHESGQRANPFATLTTTAEVVAAWKKFRELMAREEILEVHTVAGDDCSLLKVRTESIGALHTLVHQLTTAPIGLATRTTIVMQTHCEKVGGIDLGGEEPR